MSEPEPSSRIDFQNTEIAFSQKSDKELKKTTKLYSLMNNNFLVNMGSSLGLLAIKLRLPFVKPILRKTMFQQFCGGESLLDCQDTIDELYRQETFTILDYGAEGKNSDEELDAVKEEILRAIDMAASNASVPVVVAKCSGLAHNQLLIDLQAAPDNLTESNQHLYEQFYSRVDEICEKGAELGVAIYIDAEESWIQEGIDLLVEEMMRKHNIAKAIVHNTYQMYRKDKLAQLKSDHHNAVAGGYFLGAKVVRGAYMEKERAYAKEKNIPCVIQDTKADTDEAYDAAIDYCVENYDTISFCCATHNVASTQKLVDHVNRMSVERDHIHINFSQLYGMSDCITYNLANADFNVAKYVPYGPIEEVVPYLIRRAQENTSITGDMSRELSLLKQEMNRRGL